MSGKIHNGVLLPAELQDATTDDVKDAYAAKVKRGNNAFCKVVFALEETATRLGVVDLERF